MQSRYMQDMQSAYIFAKTVTRSGFIFCNLHTVFQAIVLSRLLYALPAGTGKMRVAKLRVGILQVEVRASTRLVSYF